VARAGDDVSLDALPFFTRSDGNVGLSGFCAHIAGLASGGVEAVVAETHRDWHEALRQRRFDPDLWADIAKMNATEGGIDHAFRFDNDDEFVRYLLNFIVPPGPAEQVRGLLGDTVADIAAQPTYRTDAAFSAEAVPHLTALAEAHAADRDARQSHRDALAAAARMRGALDTEAAAAANAAEAHEQARKELEEARLELARTVETYRLQRLEYQRLDAELAVTDARAVVSDAVEARKVAEVDRAAWAAVEDVLRETEADGARRAAIDARDRASVQAAPYVDALNATGQALAASLAAAAAAAKAAAVGHAQDAVTADQSRRQAVADRTDAGERRARLNAAKDNDNALLSAFNAALSEARSRGLVGRDETAADAAARTRARDAELAAADAAAVAALADLAHQTDQTRAREAHTRTALSAADTNAALASSGYDSVVERAATISQRPRLRLVVADDNLDPLTEAASFAQALRDDADSAAQELLALRAEGAVDEHALVALDRDGILPATRDVDAVIAALGAADIVAVTGWQYLAAHVDADQHAAVIAQAPEQAAGVVVYTVSPADAASRLPSIDLDTPVTLVSPDVLNRHASHETGRDPAPGDTADGPTPVAVLHPVAATHNHDAAAADAARRRERAGRRASAAAELAERDRGARALASELDTLARDCAPSAAAIAADAETAIAAAGEARRAHSSVLEELDALEATRDRLAAEQNERSETRRVLAGALERLDGLAADDANAAAAARRRLRTVDAEIGKAAEDVHRADRAERAAAIAENEARLAEINVGVVLDELTGELAGLPDPDPDPPAEPLAALRAAHAAAKAQLAATFDEDALLTALAAADDSLARARQNLNEHADAAVEAARALLNQPTGATAAARREGRQAAARRYERALAAVAHADAALDQAERARESHRPGPERQRHITVPVEPTTRADAQRLAEDAYGRWGTESNRLSTLDAEIRSRQGSHDDAAVRVQTLTDLAAALNVTPAPASGPLPEDVNEVRRAVTAASRRLDDAATAADHTGRALNDATRRLASWASGPGFAAVTDIAALVQMRERFTALDVADAVAPVAGQLASELALRSERIAQKIAEIAEHKDNVVRRLAALASDAIRELQRAGRESALPAAVGDWAGQGFFNVKLPDNSRTPDVVVARIDALVSDLVAASSSLPRPEELLWKATQAAAGERGFQATVLKPDRLQSPQRVRVAEMKKWSGGEKVTAALLLYCTFARLRAQSRHGAMRPGGGVLVMDNPLGKANYIEFLDLQRKVAAANGVQLVYFTGLGDLGAVTRFERIVAMAKRADPATGREYIGVDENRSVKPAATVVATSSSRRP
jgi:hypothetical protein